MPALDFPALPAVNQQFPVTPIAGLPQYTWDGEKWTTVGAQISNAVPASALPLMDATPAVVGVTTKYAREDHIHPTDTTRADVNAVLLKVPQGLSTTEQTDIRKNVYAAPFDALAYNGMQINGSMDVSQELGAGPVTASGAYVCDGWRIFYSGTMVPSASRGNSTGFINGLPNLITVNITTAQTSLGAADSFCLRHVIEGYRVARLTWGSSAAQPVTIGFWSAHHRTGVYTGTILNGATNRCYAFSYTHSTTDVPQYNTVTIPGDTSGTWANDNTAGMLISFALACGTTYTAPSLNTWAAGVYIAGTGQVNAVGATSDVFRITGVVVLPGIEAPSAARSPLIMRPYDQELLTCKRYWKSNGVLVGQWIESATGVQFGWIHDIEMRAAPTLAVINGASVVGRPNIAAYSISSVQFHNSSPRASTFGFVVTPAAVANVAASLNERAVSLDARL